MTPHGQRACMPGDCEIITDVAHTLFDEGPKLPGITRWDQLDQAAKDHFYCVATDLLIGAAMAERKRRMAESAESES